MRHYTRCVACVHPMQTSVAAVCGTVSLSVSLSPAAAVCACIAVLDLPAYLQCPCLGCVFRTYITVVCMVLYMSTCNQTWVPDRLRDHALCACLQKVMYRGKAHRVSGSCRPLGCKAHSCISRGLHIPACIRLWGVLRLGCEPVTPHNQSVCQMTWHSATLNVRVPLCMMVCVCGCLYYIATVKGESTPSAGAKCWPPGLRPTSLGWLCIFQPPVLAHR